MLLDALQGFEAVQSRHFLIEHDCVVLAAIAKAIQSGLSIRGFGHLVLRRFERQTHHVPDGGFVVDDENFHGFCLSSAARTVNVNVDPRPGSDCTVRRPPCASTIRREIDRPRPAPPPDACGTCTNGSKILDRKSRGIPVPVSVTEMATPSPRRTAATVKRHPGGVARIAFVTKL